ncbi:MAG: TVP38/TMEM64 family protein [Planctomycetota bacterium]
MTDKIQLGTPRFWGRVRLGALLPRVVLGVVLVVAIVIIGRDIDHHVDAIEAWIEEISPWGVLVFFGLFVVLTSFLLPDTVLAIIGGALFGLVGGTLAVVVGALAAASLQHFLAGHLLRVRIERVLSAKPSLLAIQQAVRRQEMRLQVLLRLTPLNPTVISYLLGAAGVRFSGFFAACFALIPGLFLEVYFGHAGKHLARMAGRDERTVLMHDAVIVGGLLVCVLVMVVVSRIARKAVQEAVAEVGVEESGPLGVDDA